jgi:hypothetical protein
MRSLFVRLVGAVVTLAASRLALLLVRVAQRGRAQAESEPPQEDNRTYCLENPNGVFVYGRLGCMAMVLPDVGGWQWRVKCGDVTRGGRETERPEAKRVAVETLLSVERIGVQ